MKDEYKLSSYIFTGAVYGFLLCYYIVAWGLTLSLFWKWFITPTFSVNAITYYQAVGIMTVTAIFNRDPIKYVNFLFKNPKIKDYNEVVKTYLMFMSPWLTLLAGFLIHKAMYNVL
jgi:hypothetical protein